MEKFKTNYSADEIRIARNEYKRGKPLPYEAIMKDTEAAIRNIEGCQADINALQDLYKGFSEGNTSFLKDMLGMRMGGKGVSTSTSQNSYYRDYMALDESGIVEIRIADHYERQTTLLDKANNKAQYLIQAVLIPTPPNPTATDAISSNTKVGNVQVITQASVNGNTSMDELKQLLATIRDALYAPIKLIENKRVQKIIRETISQYLKRNLILN